MTAKKQERSRLEGARARMYRDLIFESAEHVFGAKGFDGATMQDLAHEAGISLKTLYATFPGKRELYDEIQRVRGQAFLERVEAATAAGRDAIDRLERHVDAYVSFLFEHRDWLRVHQRERLAWGLGPREGYGAEYWRRGVDHLAETIAAGVEEGTFHDGDAETRAMMVLAVMQVQVSRSEPGSSDPNEVAALIITQLRRLLCRDPEAPQVSQVA